MSKSPAGAYLRPASVILIVLTILDVVASLSNGPIADCREGCLNGGNHTYLVQFIHKPCHCTEDFTGRCCDVPKCWNKGYSVFNKKEDKHDCECALEFTGRHCEKKRRCTLDYHTRVLLCFNGGKQLGTDRCSCPHGYSGRCCETINCGEHGVRVQSARGREFCQCEDGVGGLFCDATKKVTNEDPEVTPTWAWVLLMIAIVVGCNCALFIGCFCGCYGYARIEQYARRKRHQKQRHKNEVRARKALKLQVAVISSVIPDCVADFIPEISTSDVSSFSDLNSLSTTASSDVSSVQIDDIVDIV